MSQIPIKSALQTAIRDMPGIIPACNVAAFDGQLVTTAQPHGLASGMNVRIVGSATLDGSYTAQVRSPTTFTLTNTLSGGSVVKGTGTGGTVLPQLTAWPNVTFNPVAGYPFQKVNVVFARPEEPTAGCDFYREIGFLQVTLYYPLLQGDGLAMSRAELIRKTFPKGSSLTKDGVTVQFDKVAQIMEGVPTDESYIVVVRVPFYANIYL